MALQALRARCWQPCHAWGRPTRTTATVCVSGRHMCACVYMCEGYIMSPHTAPGAAAVSLHRGCGGNAHDARQVHT
jgi:hypothetical protein